MADAGVLVLHLWRLGDHTGLKEKHLRRDAVLRAYSGRVALRPPMFSTTSPQRRTLFLSLIVGLLLFHAVIAHAATIKVTSTADSGTGTLRQAIADALSGDTIDFALPANSEIKLTSGTLIVDKSLTINGPGAPLLRVRNFDSNIATNRFRVFVISGGDVNVAISGLTISEGKAGGLANITSTVALTRCVFFGNGAYRGSGGGIANTGTMTISECTISHNSATAFGASGGGISNSGSLTITNSTISGNLASPGDGGGISNYGTVNLINATISDNTADAAGGINNVSGGTVNAVNSIIAANRSNLDDDPALDFSGELTSAGHNLIGTNDRMTGTPGPGDQVGTPAAPLDPKLGPLQDNGGPTQTQALLATSTAIDAGDDAIAPPRDQRGYVRFGGSDIGAFEFGGTIPATLANISTRVQVGHDEDVLIAGFIITGSQQKRLLLRALGPSVQLGGVLADPVLALYDSAGQLIATNDNWRTNGNAQEIEATGLAPANDSESAILTSLAPGAYTAHVSGVNDGGGVFVPAIGVVEVYDLDRTVSSKLANISSRGLVQTGDNVMIAGVIVLGADSQKVIVRALGLSVGVPGPLLDPALELRNSNGALIASNDNWRSDQAAEIIATGLPPANDSESAIVRTLPPAPYTAIVRGANGASGLALVEVYAIH